MNKLKGVNIMFKKLMIGVTMVMLFSTMGFAKELTILLPETPIVTKVATTIILDSILRETDPIVKKARYHQVKQTETIIFAQAGNCLVFKYAGEAGTNWVKGYLDIAPTSMVYVPRETLRTIKQD